MEKVTDFILTFLPDNKFFYIYYLVFIFILSLLIIFYFSKKIKKPQEKKLEEKKITINDLIDIASNDKSTLKDLVFALNYFEQNFSIKTDEKKSMKFFRKILNHKNRKKILFDIFHGIILPKNLQYKKELDDLEKEALDNEVRKGD